MMDKLLLGEKASVLVLSKPQPTSSPALAAGSEHEVVMVEPEDFDIQSLG